MPYPGLSEEPSTNKGPSAQPKELRGTDAVGNPNFGLRRRNKM